MIKHWAVKNFKSIKDPVSIGFAPLTIFAGQNSAGKSTFIQTILLTAQTIQSNVAARSVVLNGRIMKFGSFSDVHANSSASGDIEVSFELGRPVYYGELTDGASSGALARYYYTREYANEVKSVYSSFSFSAGTTGELNKELQLQPQLEVGVISYKSNNHELNLDFEFHRHGDTSDAVLQRLGVDSESARIPDVSVLEYQVLKPNNIHKYHQHVYKLPAHATVAGVMLRHFLPLSIAIAYDGVAQEVDQIFELLSDSSATYRYRDLPESVLHEAISAPELRRIIIDSARAALNSFPVYTARRLMPKLKELEENFTLDNLKALQSGFLSNGKRALALQLAQREEKIKSLLRRGRAPKKEISVFPPPKQTMFAVDYVTGFFSDRVKYLGPLRDEPKAIYPLVGYSDPKDIGFKGEFTAAVLDNNKALPTPYVKSSDFPFSEDSKTKLVTVPLGEAVQDWLEYLGIAKKFATEDKGKLGHELTIATTKGTNLHDLTHVGVGVSQALPIVVLSLLSKSGTTLIFEQPELHLNPKVQTRLADFFMSLVFAGKQCIVETHSEYLISRLRYLSAMAKDVPIPEMIKIYFVDKPADQSIYNEVQIGEGGVIKNWPEGFFDETERNSTAIIQAQIERSRARRQSLAEKCKK